MQVNFSDLAAGVALLFVFEGIVPFANPSGLKRMAAWLLQIGDRELRIAGLASMLIGVAILFLTRG